MMDPQRWNKVKAIFSAAAEMPAGERLDFVQQACGGDTGISSEVIHLLESHQDTENIEIFDTRPFHSIQDGEVLGGRFRIVAFLGSGGMGEVYVADDLELGSQVALKTLRSDLLADPEFLGRFRREVQIARRVTHPNICRIFDVGHDGSGLAERVFLTMEFLDGQTLARHLQGTGKLGSEAALPLIRQMTEGLRALHEQGIVHRDFKPSNVIVVRSSTGSPRTVISDFG